jgi:MFS family permease
MTADGRSATVWTFVVTSLALVMVTLDNLVVTTALPVIKAKLHASLVSLEWTVNAYTLTFAVPLLTGATLGDPPTRTFSDGLNAAVWVGAAVVALGAIAALTIPRPRNDNALQPTANYGRA